MFIWKDEVKKVSLRNMMGGGGHGECSSSSGYSTVLGCFEWNIEGLVSCKRQVTSYQLKDCQFS
jgi:hypothetical protein